MEHTAMPPDRACELADEVLDSIKDAASDCLAKAVIEGMKAGYRLAREEMIADQLRESTERATS